jgi:hypothetical protein
MAVAVGEGHGAVLVETDVGSASAKHCHIGEGDAQKTSIGHCTDS